MTADTASRPGRLAAYALPLIVTVASLGVLVVLFANLDRGFDLTDESYYLLWLDHPDRYDLAPSMFAYLLSPIYHLFGLDPVALRRFGLVLVALAAMLLAFITLGQERLRDNWLGFAAVGLAVGATVITYYSRWLLTPSYNWMPIPAAFLLLAGLVLVQAKKAFWISVFLVAASGMVAFAAKPSTAGGFALAYGIGIVALRGWSVPMLRHVGLSALFCFLLFLLGSLTIFDAQRAFSQARTYVDLFGVSPATGHFFTGLLAPTGYYVAAAAAIASYFAPRRVGQLCGLLAIAAAFSILFSMKDMPYRAMQGMIMMSACLALVANCFAYSTQKPDGRLVFVVSLGHIFPWLIAFGTSNNLFTQTGFYVALPLSAAIITACLCFGLKDWRTYVAALIAPVCALVSFNAANEHPYRMGPDLTRQEFPVQIAGGTLRVDAQTRDFVTDLRKAAADAGVTSDTPVLDFSGSTPGVALLIGARAPYFPWMVSGYYFSETLADTIVNSLTPAQRQAAWLVHYDSPQPFTFDFMASLGFNLDSDYKVVASPALPLSGKQVRVYAPVNPVTTPAQ